MKYLYTIDRTTRLRKMQADKVSAGSWWFKETPEKAWECALSELRRSVKDQKADLKEAERDLKKTLALLAKTEERSKEAK